AAAAEEVRRSGDRARAEACVLPVRILAYRGRNEEARALLAEIHARHARAQAAAGKPSQMLPVEATLCDMLDLATRPADAEEWTALERRAEADLPAYE